MYKYEKQTGDIVISGWERGIASSPHNGLGDVKCLNISTMPGEVSVNYARIQQSQKPIVNGTATTGGLGFITYAGIPSLSRGTWITFSSITGTGLTTNTPYYVLLNPSGNNFQLSTDYEGSQITGLGSFVSGIFSTYNMGQPIAWAATDISDYPQSEYFVLDATGLVWKTPPGEIGANQSGLGTWSLIDYTPVTGADAKSGLFIYGSYVFVVTSALYYKPLSNLGHATAWTNFKPTIAGNGHYHNSIIGVDGNAYICDQGIDELKTVSGVSFDPTNATTYTWSPQALLIPSNDEASCLAQVAISGGINLIVGGLMNVLYVWTPSSASAAFSPIFIPENFTQQLLTVNNLIYIFAGSKGNVYVTSGSSATTAMTVPDYVADTLGTNQDPFYSWGGVAYIRGRIWFSLKAPNCGGIWSFVPTISYYPEQDTGLSLRLEHQNSYGTYSGMATILFPVQGPAGQQANGVQYWAGWDDGSSGVSANPYGIDFSSTTPFTNGAAIIESDLIPVGTMFGKKTLERIEYKLAAPLAPGESVQLYYRFNITDAYVSCGTVNQEVTQADSISNGGTQPYAGYFVANFQNLQWIQIKAIFTSTASNPSYCRLTEIRLHSTD